ncbi:hypothetical protein JYK14_18265 [Siccirubricoccus sp. KC 17139]|uniref:PEP-CTERM sorting domain-containing protein n=1 Tax=Siccirubricoccus soli TaxID=2899147 RepID=A0ABT1D830_9PROT|nr:hypothetical protein [Siccirubricoccus soli]MCO6418092.1 hypothetical protein [Siccirubricoccus soli]MCP2684227.1 hypothetical protein [Siccirubricoccus soli]
MPSPLIGCVLRPVVAAARVIHRTAHARRIGRVATGSAVVRHAARPVTWVLACATGPALVLAPLLAGTPPVTSPVTAAAAPVRPIPYDLASLGGPGGGGWGPAGGLSGVGLSAAPMPAAAPPGASLPATLLPEAGGGAASAQPPHCRRRRPHHGPGAVAEGDAGVAPDAPRPCRPRPGQAAGTEPVDVDEPGGLLLLLPVMGILLALRRARPAGASPDAV